MTTEGAELNGPLLQNSLFKPALANPVLEIYFGFESVST